MPIPMLTTNRILRIRRGMALILPLLVSIPAGKLGGSGSEKRISYQLHIALRTPNKRKDPGGADQCSQKNNGVDSICFIGLEETDITTIEENPNG